MDRGFFLTLQAMRRQLAAMPCDYYQIRLIQGYGQDTAKIRTLRNKAR